MRISNAKSLEVSKGADILTKDLYRLNDEICKKYGLRTLDQSKAIKNERERHAGMQPTSKKTDENYLAKSVERYAPTGLARHMERQEH